MTKQDILHMHDSKEIMIALAHNRNLWDEELSNHLREVKRKENLVRFGDADVIYRPPMRESN